MNISNYQKRREYNKITRKPAGKEGPSPYRHEFSAVHRGQKQHAFGTSYLESSQPVRYEYDGGFYCAKLPSSQQVLHNVAS